MTDFQLNELDTVTVGNLGVEVPLKKVDGFTPLLDAKKQPVTLTLLGSDSKAYRTAVRVGGRARVDRSQDNKFVVGSDAALDAMEDDGINVVVACTTGWSGVLDSKKQPVPFTKEVCKEFYLAYPPAVEQANAAIMNRALFTKASSGA